MGDLLAGLIAFLWWKDDHDRAEHQGQPVAPAVPFVNRDPKVPKAWNAVVMEFEDKE